MKISSWPRHPWPTLVIKQQSPALVDAGKHEDNIAVTRGLAVERGGPGKRCPLERGIPRERRPHEPGGRSPLEPGVPDERRPLEPGEPCERRLLEHGAPGERCPSPTRRRSAR